MYIFVRKLSLKKKVKSFKGFVGRLFVGLKRIFWGEEDVDFFSLLGSFKKSFKKKDVKVSFVLEEFVVDVEGR